MANRAKKPWPALKHGFYSTTAVLPGEDRVAFEKLHKDLKNELAPNGALEDDIIANMARLIWRKRNLATFKIAELAKMRDEEIWNERKPKELDDPLERFRLNEARHAEFEAAIEAAENQSRKELRDTYELVEYNDLVTFDELSSELDMHERLDTMIDRCLKRLLFVRGLKSISGGSASASSSKPATLPSD